MSEWTPAPTTPEWEGIERFFLNVSHTSFHVEISREEAQRLWESCVAWNLYDGPSKLRFCSMYDRPTEDATLYISVYKVTNP